MKTIVLGYDDGDSARRALARAASLARLLEAKLLVLSVARTATARRVGPIDRVDAPPRHQRQLQHAQALLEGANVEVEYQVALGEPADVIVDVGAERAADLIVVGTNEPGFIVRLLGLSVSEAVRRRARCDVLLVR